MGDVSSVEIRAAGPGDLEGIARVARRNQFDEVPGPLRVARGFLISGYGTEDYRRFLGRSDHFTVAIAGGKVLGFLLAYSGERISPDEAFYDRLARAHPAPFVLVNQVAVDPGAMGRGIGTSLYEDLFRRAADRVILAAIVLEPPNERSVAFHRHLGFREVRGALPPNSRRVGIWRRPAER